MRLQRGGLYYRSSSDSGYTSYSLQQHETAAMYRDMGLRSVNGKVRDGDQFAVAGFSRPYREEQFEYPRSTVDVSGPDTLVYMKDGLIPFKVRCNFAMIKDDFWSAGRWCRVEVLSTVTSSTMMNVDRTPLFEVDLGKLFRNAVVLAGARYFRGYYEQRAVMIFAALTTAFVPNGVIKTSMDILHIHQPDQQFDSLFAGIEVKIEYVKLDVKLKVTDLPGPELSEDSDEEENPVPPRVPWYRSLARCLG